MTAVTSASNAGQGPRQPQEPSWWLPASHPPSRRWPWGHGPRTVWPPAPPWPVAASLRVAACVQAGGGRRAPAPRLGPPTPARPLGLLRCGALIRLCPQTPRLLSWTLSGWWGQHGPGVAVVRPVRAHAQAAGVWGGRAVPGSGAVGRGDRGEGAPTPGPLHFAPRSHLLIDGTIFNQPASTSVIFHSSHRYPTKTLHA